MTWKNILKNYTGPEHRAMDDENIDYDPKDDYDPHMQEAQRGAPEFPAKINVKFDDFYTPQEDDFYTLQEVIQNMDEDYGVYYADAPNHPDSVLHLTVEEARQYAED
jgi:hypothetical protein